MSWLSRITATFLMLVCLGASSANGCTALIQMKPDHAQVLSAEVVAAGHFVPPAAPGSTDLFRRAAGMPAFCRIQARVTPTPSSDIRVEVWLPLARWNGRFLGTGNGGSAGSIAYGLERGALPAGDLCSPALLGYSPCAQERVPG